MRLAPTQTHILIRAPRRFNHPAWIPRQNVTDSLELALQEFLNKSGLGKGDVGFNTDARTTKAGKIEGVWITTRAGLIGEDLRGSKPATGPQGQDGPEDDEMIWWSWDGKLVGFSDW